jgi:mono/diheme cytochrome c family protein
MAPKSLDLLVWDSITKEQSPLPNQPTADFIFKVTNPSENDVVITDVHTSCGCTVAKLPSKPWVLAPHTNGQLAVSVNLAGKAGTFYKTITVMSTNATKNLTIKVNLPESPAMMRARNMQMAMGDAQKVFKGDCAKCHYDTSKGKMGKELYIAACGICHDARPRATMVTDLRNLKHPTDYAFWKQIVAEGKPKTMMPAFAVAHGGPLSSAQIDSLAKFLGEQFPSNSTNGVPMATGIGQPAGTAPVLK